MKKIPPINLNRMLKKIICTSEHASVTFSLNSPISLNRWLVTSGIGSQNYDLDANIRFNFHSSVITKSASESLDESEKESNWQFYLSDDGNSFYKRNSPEKLFSFKYEKKDEKYIYSLCSVYSDVSIERLIHISTMMPMPLRIWINGDLVFAGTVKYFIKNHIFSYRFQKGINTILVEKPICAWNRRLALSPKFFSFSIRPSESVVTNIFAEKIKQKEILAKYLNTYIIIPNKLFYQCNENMQIFVANNRRLDKEYEICLSTINGEYFSISTRDRIVTVPVPTDFTGVVKISVAGHNKFVFIGDYNIYAKKQIDILAAKSEIVDKYSVLINSTILNIESGFINNSIELIHEYYSQPVLQKHYAIEEYLMSKKFVIGLTNWYISIKSPIDGEPIICYLELPQSYNVQVKYPMVVYLNFDDSLTRVPTNPHRIIADISNNHISITFCGRGNYNSDYLNSYEIIFAIEYIIKKYNVDYQKIFLFGICTGGRRGINLFHEHPNIFSALFSFASTSLKAIDLPKSFPFIQLCHIDDMFYNGATVMERTTSKKNTFVVSGFEHEELIDYYCNVNAISLMAECSNNNFTNNIQKKETIKDIYLNHCCIIRPQLNNVDIANQLTLLLSRPIKMRARNYQFPVIDESDFIKKDMKNSNFVYIVKIGDSKKRKLFYCVP